MRCCRAVFVRAGSRANVPASPASASVCRNLPLNTRDSACTGNRNPGARRGAHQRPPPSAGVQFVGRLLQHVLPPGFKRMHHDGLLTPAAKAQRLALARSLLRMPTANPVPREEARAFMRRVASIEIECCAHCKTGRWHVVEHLPVDRNALSCIARAVHRPACRSPP